MNITFGAPELLVIFSYAMYSQSQAFAVVAFTLAILGKIVSYAVDTSQSKDQDKAAEIITNAFKRD
tara:strand:+ start:416 stop:613 length:198 start_codon:yes stop_codon:yes gene_type:complete